MAAPFSGEDLVKRSLISSILGLKFKTPKFSHLHQQHSASAGPSSSRHCSSFDYDQPCSSKTVMELDAQMYMTQQPQQHHSQPHQLCASAAPPPPLPHHHHQAQHRSYRGRAPPSLARPHHYSGEEGGGRAYGVTENSAAADFHHRSQQPWIPDLPTHDGYYQCTAFEQSPPKEDPCHGWRRKSAAPAAVDGQRRDAFYRVVDGSIDDGVGSDRTIMGDDGCLKDGRAGGASNNQFSLSDRLAGCMFFTGAPTSSPDALQKPTIGTTSSAAGAGEVSTPTGADTFSPHDIYNEIVYECEPLLGAGRAFPPSTGFGWNSPAMTDTNSQVLCGREVDQYGRTVAHHHSMIDYHRQYQPSSAHLFNAFSPATAGQLYLTDDSAPYVDAAATNRMFDFSATTIDSRMGSAVGEHRGGSVRMSPPSVDYSPPPLQTHNPSAEPDQHLHFGAEANHNAHFHYASPTGVPPAPPPTTPLAATPHSIGGGLDDELRAAAAEMVVNAVVTAESGRLAASPANAENDAKNVGSGAKEHHQPAHLHRLDALIGAVIRGNVGGVAGDDHQHSHNHHHVSLEELIKLVVSAVKEAGGLIGGRMLDTNTVRGDDGNAEFENARRTAASRTPTLAAAVPGRESSRTPVVNKRMCAESPEEILQRKRQQNNEAAARYRKRQRDARLIAEDEMELLTRRNVSLRREIEMLGHEIAVLRQRFAISDDEKSADLRVPEF